MVAKPSLFSKSKLGRRRAVEVRGSMVARKPMFDDRPLPLVITPEIEEVDLAGWAAANREEIDRALLRHGGILFRGFGIRGAEPFSRFVARLSGDGMMSYTYASTPRSRVHGKVYTSTEYSADQMIPMHSENAYAATWPDCLFFHAVIPAETGGETPIADTRRILARIDPSIVARFDEKQLMYVRNFGELSLSLHEVFGTEDRDEVQAFADREGIQLDWLGGDRVRARQVLPATRTHPRTGEKVWFNQAHLFHVSNLPAEIGEELLSRMAPEDLPRHVFYGDGTPIETEILDEIRAVYAAEMTRFPWQERDILLLDNMLAVHGRMPFTGERQTLVAMTHPLSTAQRTND